MNGLQLTRCNPFIFLKTFCAVPGQ
jgi:hypothetical protein